MAPAPQDGLVIVAVPDEYDKVNKVSSEKRAHMTLLYLGETATPDQILHVAQHVEHVASQGHPFGMWPKSRGKLGPNEADVLFFEENKLVNQLRHNLLMDDTVKKLYDSVEQYPEFTPHLTLGYPDKPATELDDDRQIHWVEFKRLELWTSDSSGPSFPLPEFEGMEIAMTEVLDDFLEHYGVLGMKWGKRKSRSVTVSSKAGSSKTKTSGGAGRPASTEAKKTAVTKQIAKSSGVSALSNEQLSRAVKRMQLEKQYKDLTPSSGIIGKGKRFLDTFNQTGDTALKSFATGAAIQKLAKVST